MRVSSAAPGPKGTLLFGCSSAFQHDPLSLLASCKEKYGHVVKIPIGIGSSFYLISNPTDIETVFRGKDFGRSDISLLFSPLAGGSMITADGEEWKKKRKAAAPAFSYEKIVQLSPLIDKQAELMTNKWIALAQQGKPIELQSEFVSYAMSVISLFIFGCTMTTDETSTLSAAWAESLYFMHKRIAQPLPTPYWLPTPTNKGLRNSVKKINSALSMIIDDIRKTRRIPSVQSYLGTLIQYKDTTTGNSLSNDEILRELTGLFLAGFDTVASGMMWTFYNLSKYPAWQDKIREEVCSTYHEGKIDLSTTPLLDRFFSEVLRLHPPLWLVDRKCNVDTVLGGYLIYKGNNIIMSPYVTQRDPTYWNEPLAFNPARFLTENVSLRKNYTYFPYGGGRMKCIGITLAQLELKSAVCHILKHLTLSHLDEPVVEPAFVLRTKKGININAKTI